MNSWELLLNQVVGLQKSGSRLAENVHAIAYDASTCGNLTSNGISCYYSVHWNNRLKGMYKRQTGQNAEMLHIVMMGRMITTAVTLCQGHNVFLSDTDVVFFRDPIQYAFHDANIMITATPTLANLRKWGGTFFSDQPSQYYTLNNGVVFYRSNAITNAFVLSLAAECVNSLQGHNDPQQGFLQIIFNQYMVRNKLVLQPCSKISDPVTYRLNGSPNNTVGECYDCYHGQVPLQLESSQTVSSVQRNLRINTGVHTSRSQAVSPKSIEHRPRPSTGVHPVKTSTTVTPARHHSRLNIGVYPTTRYTSYCWKPEEFHKSLLAAALALNQSDTSNWGWGALNETKSRALFTHANCLDTSAFGSLRFQKKIDWLRSVHSWFL
eukprot:gene9796-11503_t